MLLISPYSCLWQEPHQIHVLFKIFQVVLPLWFSGVLRQQVVQPSLQEHLQEDVMEVHNAPRSRATVEGIPIPPHVYPGVKVEVPALLGRQAHLQTHCLLQKA